MSRQNSGRRLAHGLIYASLLLSSACATSTASRSAFEPRKAARSHVQVTNQLFDDVTVYAVTADGAARRLGVVTGFSTRELKLPFSWMGTAPLQLHARTLASRQSHKSNPLQMLSGQSASWVIEMNPALSGATLRIRQQ